MMMQHHVQGVQRPAGRRGVQAHVAAPERASVSHISRPDVNGRFGRWGRGISGPAGVLCGQAFLVPGAPWHQLHGIVSQCRFGGRYVPETLIPALDELEAEYKLASKDPAFQVRVARHWTLHNLCSNASRQAHASSWQVQHCCMLAQPSLKPPCVLWISAAPYGVQAELDSILKDYVGRETPLYYAERLSHHFKK